MSQSLPACICMGMPMFLVSIVSEKEKRLIENMKINGMNMSYFWVATYLWFYIYYSLIMATFFFFGKYVFAITFMKYTSSFIVLTVLNGWSMAQISYAFFLSVFMEKSQTASIIGYLTAIYLTVMGMVLSFIVYYPGLLAAPWYFHIFPVWTFIRCLVHLFLPC